MFSFFKKCLVKDFSKQEKRIYPYISYDNYLGVIMKDAWKGKKTGLLIPSTRHYIFPLTKMYKLKTKEDRAK